MITDVLALEEVGLKDLPVKVLAGIALNNQVGGLNPWAVDVSLKLGGRFIWFPTFSSAAHIAHEEKVTRRAFRTQRWNCAVAGHVDP